MAYELNTRPPARRFLATMTRPAFRSAWLFALVAAAGCGRSQLSDQPVDNLEPIDSGPPLFRPDGGTDGDLPVATCDPLDLGSDLGEAVATGSTELSDSRFVGSCGGTGPEEVFRWTAPEEGTYAFDTLGSNYDTVLYVWSDSPDCRRQPRPDGCQDDVTTASGVQPESRVEQFLFEGEQVLVFVDGFDGAGDYQLNIRRADAAEVCDNGIDDDGNGLADCQEPLCIFTPACGNGSECTEQRVDSVGRDLLFGSTAGRSDTYDGSCGGGEAPDELILWTAPFAGEFTIDTLGSSFDTVLYAVRLDEACNASELPNACNDDEDVFGSLQSSIRVDVQANETIGIVIDGFGSESGDYVLSIEQDGMRAEDCDNGVDDDGNGLVDCDDPFCRLSTDQCETGDDCVDVYLGPWLGTLTGSTDGRENLLGSACGGQQAPERRFAWTAPFDGTFRFDTRGSDFDTVLTLYSSTDACESSSDVSLVCNDDTGSLLSEVVWEASAGETLLVAVDGWADSAGSFSLSIRHQDDPDVETACDDGSDNDGDGAIDCDDSDCRFTQECLSRVETDCENGVDDDGDGATDCDDSDCAMAPACGVMDEVDCDDGLDNDADGSIDCLDTDCDDQPACLPGLELDCDDDVDNDGDGFTDCSDGDCSSASACAPSSETNCTDGSDNDGDGFVDCADLDCRGTAGCLPTNETSCENGMDDDMDGATDCADPDCDTDPACLPSSESVCDDGVDEDMDGATDCEDPDCDNADACQPPPPCFDADLGSALGRRVSRGSTVGSGNDASGSCGGNFAPDRLLRWTAPTTGTYQFDTFGSQYDTLLYLWDATETCKPAERMNACDDDARQGYQSLVTTGLSAGQAVLVVVDGWNTSSGNYNLNITRIHEDPGPIRETDCFNGLDDDNDHRIDCADPDCSADCTFP